VSEVLWWMLAGAGTVAVAYAMWQLWVEGYRRGWVARDELERPRENFRME
jgi:hypothetical protein